MLAHDSERFLTYRSWFDDRHGVSPLIITGFERRPDGAWDRFDEEHVEVAFAIDDLRDKLESVGFADIQVIDWREGDATELPVRDDEQFDVVVCQEGLQFFPDRPAAMRAIRRVLAPGGRVGVAVWRSLEENGLFHDLGLVAERYLGPIDDARHSFADAEALAQLLTDAGFTDVRVDRVSRKTHFALDPAVLARLNAIAVIGMTATGKAMSDAERAAMTDAIVSASLPVAAPYVADGVLTFQTSANIAVAR